MNEIIKTIRIFVFKMLRRREVYEVKLILVDPTRVRLQTLKPSIKGYPWFIVLCELREDPIKVINMGVFVVPKNV